MQKRGAGPSSGYALTGMAPVLAAGVGARHGWTWVLRTASFRMDLPLTGRPAVGIVTGRDGAGTAVVELLAGLAGPAYGELRVLGQDLTTPQGRAAVRHRVGIARRTTRPQPGFRVRGLVGRAARLSRLPGCDRDALAAAILDRLCLTPWADVSLRAAPAVIGRKARLAAAAVHEPELLLINGLLDDLGPGDAAQVAAGIRDLGRDTTIIALGRDRAALSLACDEVLTLTDGIIIRLLTAPMGPAPVSALRRDMP
jgi:ABC-2 type transport system ATP-binding protein